MEEVIITLKVNQQMYDDLLEYTDIYQLRNGNSLNNAIIEIIESKPHYQWIRLRREDEERCKKK